MNDQMVIWQVTADAKAGSLRYERKSSFVYIYEAHRYALQLEREGCTNVKVVKTTFGEYFH